MTSSITILGSTGSIGENALLVCEELSIPVYAISANKNVKKLAKQAIKHNVKYAVTADEQSYDELKTLLAGTKTTVLSGLDSISDIASSDDVTIVLTAIVGSAGLNSTMAAVMAGKHICVANKEPLVMAGELIMQKAKENNAKIIPVDSEHSAIFQCLENHTVSEVKEIILTGSGGPFRTVKDLSTVTKKEALNHPNWSMGEKITIDSASLMNKALEIIEAKWLFNIPASKIKLLIHKESIVHSMVSYLDGSVMAQLGVPDMRTPIQYAITYPYHIKGLVSHPNFSEIASLHFEEPDTSRFPVIDYSYEAAEKGGILPVVMNAANECAVDAFLKENISFTDIFKIIEKQMSDTKNIENPSLEDIITIDKETRIKCQSML